MNNIIKLATITLLFTLSSGCAVHVRAGDHSNPKSYDSIFGGIDIDGGAEVGNLSSVNGGIDIGSNATAKSVETVNGGIEIGRNVKLVQAETVNGGIEAGKGLIVSRGLETVNGSVDLDSDSNIEGSINTVNGDISLAGVKVGQNLETVNGDIKLIKNTAIEGDITYRKSGGFFSGWSDERPVLIIDESSSVLGTIHLYRPVELKIDEGAKVGKIKTHYSRK